MIDLFNTVTLFVFRTVLRRKITFRLLFFTFQHCFTTYSLKNNGLGVVLFGRCRFIFQLCFTVQMYDLAIVRPRKEVLWVVRMAVLMFITLKGVRRPKLPCRRLSGRRSVFVSSPFWGPMTNVCRRGSTAFVFREAWVFVMYAVLQIH